MLHRGGTVTLTVMTGWWLICSCLVPCSSSPDHLPNDQQQFGSTELNFAQLWMNRWWRWRGWGMDLVLTRENRKLFIKLKTAKQNMSISYIIQNIQIPCTQVLQSKPPTFLSSAISHRLLSSAAFTCLCAGLSVSTVKRRDHSGGRAGRRSWSQQLD